MATRYDGWSADELAQQLILPRVALFDQVGSTLDVAHRLAADGAIAGTLVLADGQSAGRGRMGRSWRSEPGAGVWLTVIERPRDPAALEVLSLRVGLALAPALDPFAEARIELKWPNDLYVASRKVAGILAEARWRDGAPEWVAIGVGINVRAPGGEARGAGLVAGVSRIEVLTETVKAVRAAAVRGGELDSTEIAAFASRDLAAGRRCSAPAAGRVIGIDRSGALLVDVGSGIEAVRVGSLILEEQS